MNHGLASIPNTDNATTKCQAMVDVTASNPLLNTYPDPPTAVSTQTFIIAGIICTVYGLDELGTNRYNVTCLWLLHPRLQTQACMEPIASSMINSRYQYLAQTADSSHAARLIAVAFDQRNHGSRQVKELANEVWRSGNETHAQDMFSIYHGTAIDTSYLITYLPSYISCNPSNHIVLGVSLGGHAAWQCLFHDRRIATAVVVIGCPDYISLMTDRARLSKRESWTCTDPPGAAFIGSTDFPAALMQAVQQYDPAAMLLDPLSTRSSMTYEHELDGEDRQRVLAKLRSCLQDKRILNLAGGADKLVPYTQGEQFLQWLQKAITPGGLFEDGGVVLKDIVVDGVGHEMSGAMARVAFSFVNQGLNMINGERKVGD